MSTLVMLPSRSGYGASPTTPPQTNSMSTLSMPAIVAAVVWEEQEHLESSGRGTAMNLECLVLRVAGIHSHGHRLVDLRTRVCGALRLAGHATRQSSRAVGEVYVRGRRRYAGLVRRQHWAGLLDIQQDRWFEHGVIGIWAIDRHQSRACD
jgi:hypothetical protein